MTSNDGNSRGSQTQTQGQEEEVLLVIYDLSNGMARSMSQQFLGTTIELIPHTALVVFGREYFFGGGIQSVNPQQFRRTSRMQPIQTQSLGHTAVSPQEFNHWCRTIGSQLYNVQSYDLLERNCNNFSHDAAIQGLRLSKGVPSYILEIPQRFLGSPMGQMVRPMLEQMQVTSTPAVDVVPSTTTTTTRNATSSSASAAIHNNPWASLPATSSTTTTTTSSSKTAAEGSPYRPSILQKYTKPMLSQDKSTIKICKKKLASKFDGEEEEKWNALCDVLVLEETTTAATTDCYYAPAVVQQLWKLLEEETESPTTSLYVLLT
jgi:hypothetical protein